MTTPDRRIRVLHIFKRMDRGGAETWIVNVLRTIDRSTFQFDFLVEPGAAGQYDEEIRQLGGRIIQGPSTSNPVIYALKVLRFLKRSEPYDVVHSHVHHFSGLTLAIAKFAGVPVRMAHSHNDLRGARSSESFPRRLYLSAMKWFINRCVTVGLAVSEDAATSLFGSRWRDDERIHILHCGIDLKSFTGTVDGNRLRSELGIPIDGFVIGHVGSFTSQKNHHFLIDVFAAVAKQRSDAYLLLIGRGPREAEIRQQIRTLGLSDRVILAGVRSDVPTVMRGVMDCFLLPSLHEGIPLVLMETQAAGLPSVISDSITEEAIVVPQLFRRMSLSESHERWASALVSLSVPEMDTVKIMSESTFNVQNSAERLEALYGETNT